MPFLLGHVRPPEEGTARRAPTSKRLASQIGHLADKVIKTEPRRAEIRKIRRDGTAALILGVINDYASRNQPKVKSPEPEENTKESIVSYKLTLTDLNKLKEEMKRKNDDDAFINELGKMTNKAYENKKSFKNTIESIVKTLNVPENKLVNLSLKHSKNKPTYRLTDKSFERMTDNNVTQKIANDILTAGLTVLDQDSEWRASIAGSATWPP